MWYARLAFAAFLAFALLGIVSAHDDVSGAVPDPSPTVHICDDPTTTPPTSRTSELKQVLTLNENEENISFMCTSSQGKTADLLPDAQGEHIFDNESCTHTLKLQDLFPNATLKTPQPHPKPGSTEPVYTLNVPLQNRTSRDIWYKCVIKDKGIEHDGGRSLDLQKQGKECKIKITVRATPNQEQTRPEQEIPQNGDQTGPKVTECPADSVTARVAPGTPFKFKCGGGMVLKPESANEVFDDTDGHCKKSVALTSLVPGASLERPDAGKLESVYTLSYTAAPENDTALCYRCVKPTNSSHGTRLRSTDNETKEEQCLLKLSIRGSSGALPSAALMSEAAALALGGTVLAVAYEY
ncbi:hypothetical protein BESB_033750 [Besnoitia besnoiti]|uniref:SRS domain-containing protein n=1 Tax=Besnoitia besnoiti TaxID=94643 RepID=A0A2A9MMD3_BESBE|nr:hypothetical protein BESB_033750 [Besnoitia besnoiti]PFH36917.1 hypothetical protein BESB_033750 [Besnoitia besnoiti]